MIARLRRLSLPARAAIAAAVLTAFFIVSAAQQIWLRAAGQEIVVDVEPVDPRDVFFGHYVILTYAAERPDPELWAGPGDPAEGASVWLVMQPDEDGVSRVAAVGAEPPPAGALALRGRVRAVAWDAGPARFLMIDLDAPDRYYAAAGTARALEDRRQDRALQVILSVRNGDAALKGLVVDGERRYDSLF